MYTVDIDTGGTMTDCLVNGEGKRLALKVDTTSHDYTISFHNCLIQAAEELGYDSVSAFLREISLIRWSSTITTNVLAERRGAKVGLIVSEGAEETLYGASKSPIVGELVASENVISLSDTSNADEILASVKDQLERGARRICISLASAFPNNDEEAEVKRVIEDQYPDHIIGSVPVLLGSEMAQTSHDQTRAHYSIMNAYTHTHLANSLFNAEDMLRDQHGWNGALLIGHTSGGVARIGKTKAVDTIESGPVFGTFGAAYMAREYGLNNLVCLDVGGTTTKVSVVRDGEPVYKRGGKLMGVPVEASFALLRSAALGGGSVARVSDGTLKLGPESMGAAPGPACYGLGGGEATLTDALLILGYLDGDNFLGGRRKLDSDRAKKAIEANVAAKLGVKVFQAAMVIRDQAVRMMADLITDTVKEAKVDISDCTLFSYGGNGPLFGAFVADEIGLRTTYAFDIGPVFSAFGSAISDVVHTYERGIGETWVQARGDLLIEAADVLYRQAVRDLDGEGFEPAKATYFYKIEFRDVKGGEHTVSFETAEAPGDAWLEAAQDAVPEAGIAEQAQTTLIGLRTVFHLESQALKHYGRSTGNTKLVPRSMMFSGDQTAELASAVWESMGPGDSLSGPTVINGGTLTCVVPPGWLATVDDHGNTCLARQS